MSLSSINCRAPGSEQVIHKSNGGVGDAPVTVSTDKSAKKRPKTESSSSEEESSEEEVKPPSPPPKPKKEKKAKKEKKVRVCITCLCS